MTLIATSSDGYASIFTFEEGELGIPCVDQPARPLSKYEESQLANAGSASPIKPTILHPKPQQKEEAITIPSSPATVDGDQVTKVKKRATLTTTPLDGAPA
jgi:hypothetical protein